MRGQFNNEPHQFNGYPPPDFRFAGGVNHDEIGGIDDPLSPDEMMQLEQMGAIFRGGVQISE